MCFKIVLELQQIVACANIQRQCIPEFSRGYRKWRHGKIYPRTQCAQVRFNPAGKGTSRAEIFRKIVLQVWNHVRSILNVTLTVSHPKKVQRVAIIFKHFYQNLFFSRAFQVPLKSNIKFQGFSRTSRSSMSHVNGKLHLHLA